MPMRGPRPHARWYTDEDVEKVKRFLWNGYTYREAACLFEPPMSRTYVAMIKNGEVRGDVPWPDGSPGGMPRNRRDELNGRGTAGRPMVRRDPPIGDPPNGPLSGGGSEKIDREAIRAEILRATEEYEKRGELKKDE